MCHRFLTESNDRKNTANFLQVIAQTRMQIGRWLNLRGLVQELTLNDYISRKRGEHIKQHLNYCNYHSHKMVVIVIVNNRTGTPSFMKAGNL